MFCSKCGKTIPQGSGACVHCGMKIAESEFSAASYIASQPVLNQDKPEGDAPQHVARYTRMSYTTMSNESEGDVLRSTSYRPVYQDPESRQEDPEQDAQQEEEQQESDSVQADPSSLPDDLRARPLRKVTPAGISPETAEFMRQSAEQSVETEGRKSRPIVSSLFSSFGRGAKTVVPRREVPQQAEVTEEEPAYDEVDYDDTYEEESEAFDSGEVEEEEPQRSRAFPFRWQNREPVDRATVLKRTVVATVAILILLVVGFLFLTMSTAIKSPLSNVTYTLYDKGIAMLESHTTADYRKSMSDLYNEDQTGTKVLLQQQADQDALSALLPGTQLANDKDFMNTLQAIQNQIDIAVAYDAMGGDQQASEDRWKAINNAISRLKETKDPTELRSIASAAEVTITPAPSPSPTPSPYTTLYKGMNNNEEVKAMQNRLYDLGWFTSQRDGDFGALTQTAVKQFQQAAGLSVTGIADADTLDAIYADDAPRTGIKITPAPTSGDGNITGEPLETAAPAQPGVTE